MLVLLQFFAHSAASAAEPATPLHRCDTAIGQLPGGLAAAKRAVVHIETTLGGGSGLFVSPDGFVLTAAHVVGGARTVQVVLEDKSTLTGEVVRKSDENDVALIRTSASKTPCAPMAKARTEAGADLYVIGSPGGGALSHSVSRGVVSAYRESTGRVFVQTDASISPGNSGGPMFGADGSVASIVSFKAVGAGIEGLGFGLAAESIPAALGVEWSVATAAEFPARLGNEKPAAAAPGPQVTSRPASASLFKVSRGWCDKWAKEETDPFSGEQVISVAQPYGGANGYVIDVRSGGMSLRWSALLAQLGMDTSSPEKAAAIALTLALEDSTRVTLYSTGAAVLTADPYFGLAMRYEFPISAEAIEALGSSELQAVRFAFEGGRTASIAYDKRSPFNKSDFMSAASCVAVAMKPRR